MAYSCPDYVDSMLEALGITLGDDAKEEVAYQAMLSLGRIVNMQEALDLCRMYLRGGAVTARDDKEASDISELIDRIDNILVHIDAAR
jgi:hypothetical protein